MKTFEIYSQQTIYPGAYPIVRIDGRGFSRVTEDLGLKKPYSYEFFVSMAWIATSLMEEFNGMFSANHSDEISIAFPPEFDMFNRRHEKVVSTMAGMASSLFTHHCDHMAHFDARVIVCPTLHHVEDYFVWRQQDATKNCMNDYCHAILSWEEYSKAEIVRLLDGVGFADRNEILFKRGINFNDFPVWQRRGGIAYWEEYTKVGWNPIAEREEMAERRRVIHDPEPPRGYEYRGLVQNKCRV